MLAFGGSGWGRSRNSSVTFAEGLHGEGAPGVPVQRRTLLRVLNAPRVSFPAGGLKPPSELSVLGGRGPRGLASWSLPQPLLPAKCPLLGGPEVEAVGQSIIVHPAGLGDRIHSLPHVPLVGHHWPQRFSLNQLLHGAPSCSGDLSSPLPGISSEA